MKILPVSFVKRNINSTAVKSKPSLRPKKKIIDVDEGLTWSPHTHAKFKKIDFNAPESLQEDKEMGTAIQSAKKTLAELYNKKKKTKDDKSLAELNSQIQTVEKELDEKVKFMAEKHIPFAIKVARDFQFIGVDIEDLNSFAYIGLIKAAEKFNPAGHDDVKFSTYASNWIKQTIRNDSARMKNNVRIPIQAQIKIQRIKTATAELEKTLKRKPTNEEIAAAVEMKPYQVMLLKQSGQKEISIHSFVGEDQEDTFENFLAGGMSENEEVHGKMLKDFKEKLPELLESLSDIEKTVIIDRFGLGGEEPKTLDEIGIKLKKTRERIRQIQNIVLKKIRECLNKSFKGDFGE